MRIGKRCVLFLILCMIPAALWSVLPLSAQSGIPRWSAPQLLGHGWFPSITVDATDTVHVGWHGGDEERPLLDLFWYTSKRPGESFQTPRDVIFAAEGGYTIRSAIDVSNDGVLYAMYRTGVSHAVSAAPADKGQSVQEWRTLVNLRNAAYYLDMMVDQDNVIHAVSSEQNINLGSINMENLSYEAVRERFPCAFCSDLLYRRSEDGGRTWSLPVNLSNTFEGSERQNIFQGRSGRIYVTWNEGLDWYVSNGAYQDVRFVYSDDGGHTWSDSVILTGEGLLPPSQFALTELNSGALLAVWRYATNLDNKIYYQISEDVGQTWTDPERVPYILTDDVSASALDRYELLTDLAGVVHLFAVGFHEVTQEGPALFHMEYRQGTWVQPIRIYYDPDVTRPEWPSADIGPRNSLSLSWFVRVGDGRDAADVGTVNIFYANRAANLPDRQVLVAYAPTLTPVPPPTEIPRFEPTATVIPTLAPLDPNANVGSNRDQYATQTLVGAVLAVALLCVGILVISGYRPRS